MAIETWINISGTFKEVNDLYVNVSGTFKKVTEKWVNVAGTFKQVFQTIFPISDVILVDDTGNANFCEDVDPCNPGSSSCQLGPPTVIDGDQNEPGYVYLWTKVSGDDLDTGGLTEDNVGYFIAAQSYNDGEQIVRFGTWNLKVTDSTGNATSINHNMGCSAGNSGP